MSLMKEKILGILDHNEIRDEVLLDILEMCIQETTGSNYDRYTLRDLRVEFAWLWTRGSMVIAWVMSLIFLYVLIK